MQRFKTEKKIYSNPPVIENKNCCHRYKMKKQTEKNTQFTTWLLVVYF